MYFLLNKGHSQNHRVNDPMSFERVLSVEYAPAKYEVSISYDSKVMITI